MPSQSTNRGLRDSGAPMLDIDRGNAGPFCLVFVLVLIVSSCANSPTCGDSCTTETAPGTSTQAPIQSQPESPQQPTPEERSATTAEAHKHLQHAVSVADESTVEAAHRWRESIRAQAIDPEQPLPDPVRRALADIEFDPPPESLTRDTHYWVSNEDHHYLFRPTIDGHGGIYLGVGTDQNYLMGAWAKSPILLLMDFDEQIRNVHHLYGIIFQHVDSPQEFIDQWAQSGVDEIHSWLAKAYDEPRLGELENTLDIARQTIHWRLRTTANAYREREIPTFLTDQDQYDFVRDLWKHDRVFPIRGDLTADTTMVDIAETLRDLDLNLGLMYPSNAEQYFDFTPNYRRNIAIQPFDDTSLVLRTRSIRKLGYPEDGDYHYNIHDAQNFADWMKRSRIKNSARLLLIYNEQSETDGLSFINHEPEHTDPPPEVADITEDHAP